MVNIVTLGCSKNLVDSEHLSRQLSANGYKVCYDNENPQGGIVVVNTCGFIGDAKEESVNTILDFGEMRKKRKISKLIVMGCLSQRYRDELAAEIPEVDKFYGKFDWKDMLAYLGKSYEPQLAIERDLTTPPHYAYLKISEGCNRRCSYCAIPIMTGRHISRPVEEIVAEVKSLVGQGVKEFQVIAQDLSYYGMDLYHKMRLADLVNAIADVEGVEWIRLHYAYPAQFPTDVLDVMRERDNVCKYLDIAFQHISDHMLDVMHRHVSKQETYELIERIREGVPGIHLRTTLLTGHPGETEEDVAELLDFVKWARFERMGCFPYSDEDGTYANLHYKDDIPFEEKQRRVDVVMSLQERISAEINEQKVGRTLKVMIDKEEGDYYVGRTEYDSPEVDPEVIVKKNKVLQTGNFARVRITGCEDYDLFGEAE